MCQPIGTDVFGEDILLLVDKKGLVCKYAGQALASNIWPAPFYVPLLDLEAPRSDFYYFGPGAMRSLAIVITIVQSFSLSLSLSLFSVFCF